MTKEQINRIKELNPIMTEKEKAKFVLKGEIKTPLNRFFKHWIIGVCFYVLGFLTAYLLQIDLWFLAF